MATEMRTNTNDEVILIDSSDEDETQDTIPLQEKFSVSVGSESMTGDSFVTLLTLFGKRLKDEKRLKILCRMHNNAGKFTSTNEFRKFVELVIVELKRSESMEQTLLLMTSVCQTLGLKEVVSMWNQKDEDGNRRNYQSGEKSQNSSGTSSISPCTGEINPKGKKSLLVEYNSKKAASPMKEKSIELLSNEPVTSTVKTATPRVMVNFDLKRIEDIARKLKQKKPSNAATTSINCVKSVKASPLTEEKTNDVEISRVICSRTDDTSKKKNCDMVSSATHNAQIVVLDTGSENEKFPTNDKPKSVETDVKVISRKFKIRILEKKLESMEKKILDYASVELSYNDLESEDSAYMQEANLKEKFVKTWRRYCKLIGEDADELISSKKKIKVTSSPFPEINRSIAKFVNRTGNFPNLFEVKRECLKANDKYHLELKSNDLHNCAVDVFTEVGRKLQKNRERDYRHTAGNVLTDQVKQELDPAITDTDLKKKLKRNRKLAKQNTDQVFTDFVRQQYEQESTGVCDRNASDGEESDDCVKLLETLRKKDLIDNKRLKHDLIKKNACVVPTKKRRKNDQTVISVTVSSSQEHDKPSTSKKVDYCVTIDSPLSTSLPSKMKKKFKPTSTISKKPTLLSHNDETENLLGNSESAANLFDRNEHVSSDNVSCDALVNTCASSSTNATTYVSSKISGRQSNVLEATKSSFALSCVNAPLSFRNIDCLEDSTPVIRNTSAERKTVLGLNARINESSVVYTSPLRMFSGKRDDISNRKDTNEKQDANFILISDDEE